MEKDVKNININESKDYLFDFDGLLDEIFGQFRNLGFLYPGIHMYDEENDSLIITRIYLPNSIKNSLKKFLGVETNGFMLSVTSKDNTIVKAYLNGTIVQEKDLKGYAQPYLSSNQIVVLNKLFPVGRIIAVPIKNKNNVIGVYTFVIKKDRDLNNSEKKFVSALGEELGYYLEQSWKIRSVIKSNSRLKEQKENLKKLVDLKSAFLVDVNSLLSDLEDNVKDNELKKRIHLSSQYLKSLYLMDEIVNK